MKSPLHPEADLETYDLDPGLTVWRCPISGGHWIPSTAYWQWHAEQEKHGTPQAIGAPSISVDNAERPALICPESNHLLVRYKVGQGLDFYVDRSPGSGGIWLDAGEWEALKEHNLHTALHMIFSSSYQKRILREEAREVLRDQFADDVGLETMESLENFSDWLVAHPKRRRIIAWLHEQISSTPPPPSDD